MRVTGKSAKWLAVIALVIVVIAIQAYLEVIPPVTIISSGSMQHSDNWQYNILNTGDMALVKKVHSVSNVVTYVQGRETGMKTFGDYGNVIIYKTSENTLIIHRAIFYLSWNHGKPVIQGYTNQSWIEINGDQIIIHGMGYAHRNLLVNVGNYVNDSGFITTGDYNLGSLNISYDLQYNAYGAADQDGIFPFNDPPVNVSQILGKAVFDIPWLGLVKLTIQWGLGLQHQETPVPNGSYTYLSVTLIAFFTVVMFPYRRVSKLLRKPK